MTFERVGSMERLPCGCLISVNTEMGGPFYIEPHALDCQYYLFALAESKRQGKPVVTVDVR